MPDQSLDPSTSLSTPDKRLLLALKLFIVLIVIGLLVAGHGDELWPVITWPMYDQYGRAVPGPKANTLQVVAISGSGQHYTFWEQDIYGQLPSGVGRQIFETAFDGKGSRRDNAYPMLIARVRTLLPGVDVARIQAWQLRWNHAQIFQTPPFDIERPDERRLIGSIDVHDFEAVDD